MAVEVILPKVDMDMSTGTISKWHVKDGDTVKKGTVLFEIETDKAAMEIDSPGDGVIRLANAPEKTPLPIGTIVAMIYGAGETPVDVAPAAVAAHVEKVEVKSSGSIATTSETRASDGRRATPLARRLAKQHGLTLADISGTGPHGRITSADVLAVQAKAPAAAPVAAPLEDVAALYAAGGFEVRKLDGMRRTIAQRLTQSKQTIPHFYLQATCTLDAMLALRERLNGLAPRDGDNTPKWKLSINDFVIKAMALALQRVPAANVTFAGDSILQHRVSDVGVAVSVEGGLFTPVVRHAEAKTLSQISIEMKDLAARARARKLHPSEYQGGTTAISNLGMFGVEQFNAIINPPHASILAVGAGVQEFVPENGLPVLKTRMTVTLSVDHRAVDGAVGAELLAAFKQLLEDPALMLV